MRAVIPSLSCILTIGSCLVGNDLASGKGVGSDDGKGSGDEAESVDPEGKDTPGNEDDSNTCDDDFVKTCDGFINTGSDLPESVDTLDGDNFTDSCFEDD